MSNASEPRHWAATAAAALSGVAVALGAWSAHGLAEFIQPVYEGQTYDAAGVTTPAVTKYVGDFKTGVLYLLTSSLAVLAVASWSGRSASAGRWLLLAGACVFSGSLFALVLSGVRWLGAITPIGGTLLIVGWACLCVSGGSGLKRG